MSKTISTLCKEVMKSYTQSVGLAPDPHYYGGARLRPVVPLDTAIGGIMIVGAYPSARFETVNGMHNVPVADNLGPFEPERYFDGSRVRTQASADELKQFYLEPLGVSRERCWITDLVKVFLFKPGHREKYQQLGCEIPAGYDRERFEEIARTSIPWLEKEVVLAKPKLILTLGAEVAGILWNVAERKARTALLSGIPNNMKIGNQVVPTVHLAHPGIVMRKSTGGQNPWPTRHSEEHIPDLQKWLVEG